MVLVISTFFQQTNGGLTMAEFLLFILVIVVLWKASSALNGFFSAINGKAEGYAEDQLKDIAIERQERMAELRQEMSDKGITKFDSHDDFLKVLGYKKK
jgi:hypothetical protein